VRIYPCEKKAEPEAVKKEEGLSYDEILQQEGIYKTMSSGIGHVVVLRHGSSVSSFYVSALSTSIEPVMGLKYERFKQVPDAKLCIEIK
jgi:hypothetical protein